MFAEELKGNASRKRAEENRARRRRLLQEQQQQQLKKNAAAAISEAAAAAPVQKKNGSDTTASPSATTTTTTASLAATVATTTSTTTTTTTTTTATKPRTLSSQQQQQSAPPLSAVERAARERQLRAAVAQKQKAAVVLQSFVRSCIGNAKLRAQHFFQLQQRLQDLQTLRTLLLQKQKQQQQQPTTTLAYVPPPATTAVLTRQFLFVARTIPYKRRCKTNAGEQQQRQYAFHTATASRNNNHTPYEVLLVQLLEFCILPGLYTSQQQQDDPNVNALLVWLESPHGRLRLQELLRLTVLHVVAVVVCSSGTSMDDNNSSPVFAFLRYMVGVQDALLTTSSEDNNNNNSMNQALVRYGRSLLLPTTTACTRFAAPSSSSTSSSSCWTDKFLPFALQGASLDLIAISRYQLLFCMNTSSRDTNPIPKNAQDLGPACISDNRKNRAGALVTLILQAVLGQSSTTDSSTSRKCLAVWNRSELHLLRVRVLTNLLTVPLFTWKVSSDTLTYLLTTAAATTKSSSTTILSSSFDIRILALVESLVELHSETLAAGSVNEILMASNQDVSLTQCPATPSQCLLANLMQFCHECPALNGINGSLDFPATTLYFHLLATLLDVVPAATFSSRDSSVEWLIVDGHHTPVVLSRVILDQCKMLLLDSLVRRLFQCATTSCAQFVQRIDNVLATKNDKDLKHEKDLVDAAGGIVGGGAEAVSLAAKEARVDRNKSFWNSSGWARKLTRGVTTLLSGGEGGGGGDGGTTTTNSSSNGGSSSGGGGGGGGGALLNTSSMSRKLASGTPEVSSMVSTTKAEVSSSSTNISKPPSVQDEGQSLDLFLALCRTYSIVLARWGGGGREDIVRRGATNKAQDEVAKAEVFTLSLLNTLCFSTSVVRASWGVIQSDSCVVSDVYSVIDSERGAAPVRTRTIRPSYRKMNNRSARMDGDGAVLLYLFVCTLAHVLIVTDDTEFHDMDRPLPVHQLRRCIQVLKKLLYRACCIDDCPSNNADASTAMESNYSGLALIAASSRAMRDLYDRSSRRPLCVPKLWLVPDLLEKEIRQCKKHGDYVALLSSPVLRVCPFLVSFKRRLRIFERIVTTSRIEIQGVNDANPFHSNPLRPGIPVRITRGRLLEDGLATMNHLGANMRQRIAVQYVNEAGARESGVDVGGLFKEFWTDLSGIAFDPNYALFSVTDGAGNCLYPNPSSGAAHGSDHIVLFEFLGRILGKALYEGITIHPRFAHFFLSFLRGDYNFLHMLPDLSTVDPQLYNNLMFLKTFEGDAADLCLTFTVTSDEFGGTREIQLIPNGANVEVTNENKHRYLGLVAKYYVVDRVKEQSEAFTRGLWEVIDRSWLRLFNEPELQVLISGSSDGKIDVEDMRANTRYAGGYSGLDRSIHRFWNVVASMSSKQQADLLRFVTSCERPPPLGFSSMNPPFTIQRVGILRDGDQLPSASTCFNTLKLPTYSSEKVMKQRLIYSIESGAGFELT